MNGPKSIVCKSRGIVNRMTLQTNNTEKDLNIKICKMIENGIERRKTKANEIGGFCPFFLQSLSIA
jgi:hypothetical protein